MGYRILAALYVANWASHLGVPKPGCFKPGCFQFCPESVPGVSKRCPGHSGDTLGTLFGHSGARGPKGPGDTPSDTPSDTPHFRGHSRGHSGDTSGPKGPRDSCSRPAGFLRGCALLRSFVHTLGTADAQMHICVKLRT